MVVEWDMARASDGGGTDEVQVELRMSMITGKRAHTASRQMIDAQTL